MTHTKKIAWVALAIALPAGLWMLRAPEAPAAVAKANEPAAEVAAKREQAPANARASSSDLPETRNVITTLTERFAGGSQGTVAAKGEPVERKTAEELPVEQRRTYYAQRLEAHEGVVSRLQEAIAKIEADETVSAEAKHERASLLRTRVTTEQARIEEVVAKLDATK